MKTIISANPATWGHFEITLPDGRLVWLDGLHQWHNYSGMLAGYPNRHGNERLMERNRERALQLVGQDFPLVILPPSITTHDYPSSGAVRIYSCESLPAVFSVGCWNSTPTSRDEGCNSSVYIAWYQRTWGVPDVDCIGRLRELEWDEIAKDWMW